MCFWSQTTATTITNVHAHTLEREADNKETNIFYNNKNKYWMNESCGAWEMKKMKGGTHSRLCVCACVCLRKCGLTGVSGQPSCPAADSIVTVTGSSCHSSFPPASRTFTLLGNTLNSLSERQRWCKRAARCNLLTHSENGHAWIHLTEHRETHVQGDTAEPLRDLTKSTCVFR